MGLIQQLIDSSVFSWVILPLLIFISKIFDVSIGTLRIIFISRGKKTLAPIPGFFEVSIWILAIGQIMQNLDNIVCFLAYAGGYAMGNYVGYCLKRNLLLERLSSGFFLFLMNVAWKSDFIMLVSVLPV